MSETVRAFVVVPDVGEPCRVVRLTPDLERLQGLVGGWLEAIYGRDWHAYVDEEGMLAQKPANVRATALAQVMGWLSGAPLYGPVVFLGDGTYGAEGDVPERLVRVAREELSFEVLDHGSEGEDDGTSGQDRDSYTDDQDRD